MLLVVFVIFKESRSGGIRFRCFSRTESSLFDSRSSFLKFRVKEIEEIFFEEMTWVVRTFGFRLLKLRVLVNLGVFRESFCSCGVVVIVGLRVINGYIDSF